MHFVTISTIYLFALLIIVLYTHLYVHRKQTLNTHVYYNYFKWVLKTGNGNTQNGGIKKRYNKERVYEEKVGGQH